MYFQIKISDIDLFDLSIFLINVLLGHHSFYLSQGKSLVSCCLLIFLLFFQRMQSVSLSLPPPLPLPQSADQMQCCSCRQLLLLQLQAVVVGVVAPHWEFACRVPPPAYLSFQRPPCCKQQQQQQHAACGMRHCGHKLCRCLLPLLFRTFFLAAPIALKVMSPVARHPNTTQRCSVVACNAMWAVAVVPFHSIPYTASHRLGDQTRPKATLINLLQALYLN